jgi:hypothetical protein
MENKCNVCRRTSDQTEGWWQVLEHPTAGNYSLCASCYRNKSLLAYRDTLLERIDAIDLPYQNGAEKIGMEVMKLRCQAIVTDTVFNV